MSLWPLLSDTEHQAQYRRPPQSPGTDTQAGLRAVFARTADEPLPDLSGLPREVLAYEAPVGTYFDAYPLLVMTSASLLALQDRAQGCAIDVRRFRPNIVLETEAAGFTENDWVGRHAQLGSAVLQFELRCPRCIMTTHGFAELPTDPQIMRHLVRHNDGDLGVYATVAEPGRIAVGDRLTWL